MNAIAVGVFLVPAIAVGVAVVWAMVAPVSRSRVERFARRQQLLITPDNGNGVIRYLAITRRWRAGGILVAFGLGIVWLSTRIDFSGEINFLQLFAGWFAGAVLAEARLSRTPADQRRRAIIQPRDASMYLRASGRYAIPAALALSLAIGLLTAVLALLGREPDARRALLAQVAALAVAAVVTLVGRHVLNRPQPLLPPDQLAADDAIRSRSLHVLAGSGAALVLYAVISQLTAVAPALPALAADIASGAAFVLVLAAPLLGWLIATWPWTVRRPVDKAKT